MTDEIVETINFGHGVIAKIVPDHDPAIHPREDQDNLATMTCWHRRYRLGDEHAFKDPDHLWAHLLEQVGDAEKLRPVLCEMWNREVKEDYRHQMQGMSRQERADGREDFICEQVRYGTTPAVRERIIEVLKQHGVIHCIQPLFLFDHSGITISTGCRWFRAQDPQGWDWGPIGYVYVTEAQREKMGTPLDRVEPCLDAEVEEYDKYLRGEVYGVTIQTRDEPCADSCWGFIGLEWAKEYAGDMASHYVRNYADPGHYKGAAI